MIAKDWDRTIQTNYSETSPNVLRIKNTLLTHFAVDPLNSTDAEDYWNYLFPFADSFYTFDSFLSAASRFPYFCNDSHMTESLD